MSSDFSFWRSLWRTLDEGRRREGLARTLAGMGQSLWQWLLEQTPERRRSRYGDLDFDLERELDTTRANVSRWTQLKAALLGTPYFASQPYLFDEMMQALEGKVEWRRFAFVDLGCGKGRAMFLAADFPFRQIIGVELVPELHAAAAANVAALRKTGDQRLEAVEADVRDYELPAGDVWLYLFNPFGEAVVAAVMEKIAAKVREGDEVMVAYRLPEQAAMLESTGVLQKWIGTEQWVVYGSVPPSGG